MACPNQYYYDQYGYYLSYVYPQYPSPVQATCQTLNPPTSAVHHHLPPAGGVAAGAVDGASYTPTVQAIYQATQPDYTTNNSETPYYNSQYIPEYTGSSAYTCTPPTQSSSTPNSNAQQIPMQHPIRIFCQTDQDLIEQIKTLVETALSNSGLQKEPYLVKQISRSTTGFISLKLIASLRQVRRLTRNIQLIIEALRRSSILELSEDCHKVRRKEAMPSELSRPKPISTILAIRVPEEDAEIDRLSAIFKVHGKIQQMRIVPPEKKLPNYLLGYATQVPELGTEMCAVVEFASDESAMAACKTFHHSGTSEDGTSSSSRGMRVALLGPRLKRNLYGNRRQSLSCQSSVISSLDVSLEECIIGGADNITDTDSGFHQAPNPRARIPSGSSESNTPRSEDESSSSPASSSGPATPQSTPPQSPDSSPTQKIKTKIETKNLTRRRNSEISRKSTDDSDSS